MNAQGIAYLDNCYDLLPPFIRAVERKGTTVYLNDATGEFDSRHPLDRFKERIKLELDQTNSLPNNHSENGQESMSFTVDNAVAENMDETRGEDQSPVEVEKPISEKNDSGQPLMEYHCQWKERNAFGQMSMYGLTLRYNIADGTTSLRFDGVSNSDWTFTALKGPFGALEPQDLYVGARVEVFGRHLTISSANSASVRWIENEAKRLGKLQDRFRKKIESVGQKPIVIPPKPGVIRNVERVNKKAGQINLRKLLNDVSKLGEQLAQLGLSEFALL